jgi:hypothetical protein
LAGFQGLLASDRTQPIAISPVETIQQAGQRPDEIVRLGQHHACRYRAIRPVHRRLHGQTRQRLFKNHASALRAMSEFRAISSRPTD